MRRKKGLADITYCKTKCLQEGCARNLIYYKPPEKLYSVSNFDEEETDELHMKCEYKITKENA